MDNNYWVDTVNFINNIPSGKTFKLIDVKKHVYKEKNMRSSVGSYINFLNQAHYIKKYSHGKYIRIKDIPESLTTTKIINFLYHNPLKERLDKIEQIRKKLNEK